MNTLQTSDSESYAIEERKAQIRAAREGVFSSAYFWLEDLRTRIIRLLTNNPDELDQKDIAKRVGVTPAAISSFLNGADNFKALTYLNIVAATGYSPLMFFMRTNELAELESHGVDPFRSVVLSQFEACLLFQCSQPDQMTMMAMTFDGTTMAGVSPVSIDMQMLMDTHNVEAVTLHARKGKNALLNEAVLSTGYQELVLGYE